MTIYHSTPGNLSLTALTTFGLSVKENAGAIGQFGTGLKYAIAVLLRNNAHITINGLPISAIEDNFRGRAFVQPVYNGTVLPFTTDLGKHWELWMAKRELHSNTLDENGITGAEPIEGWTNIAVTHEEYESIPLDTIFRPESEKIDSGGLYSGPSKYVYCKGVRVYELATPLPYTLDAPFRLTEDRTIRDGNAAVSATLVAICNDAPYEVCKKLISADHAILNKAYWWFSSDLTEHIKRMIGENVLIPEPILLEFHQKVPDSVELLEPNEEQLAALYAAKRKLTQLGYIITAEIHIAPNLGVLGYADMINNKILLSPRAFITSRHLLETLFEEHAHIASGLGDCTRGFQEWLIREVINRPVDVDQCS